MTGPEPRPAPLRLPVLRDRQFAFDFVLACVIAIGSVAIVGDRLYDEGPIGPLSGLALLSAVMLRRVLLRGALALAVVAAFSSAIAGPEPSFVVVAVPVMVYTSARYASEQQAKVALAFGLVGSLLGPVRWLGSTLDLGRLPYLVVLVFACAGLIIGPYLLGRRRSDAIAARTQQRAGEVERQRLVRAEQDQRTQSTALAERQRIARELHDIVAHSLSVIVVQAEGGRALAAKHPERATEVLSTIAEASREALEEMRTMVGLLRNETDENASRRPAPGLADIPELVRRTSERATLVVQGSVPVVPQALGLTAYRTVQESLTNMLKHAGPGARAEVRIDYHPDAVWIAVTDDGRGAGASNDDPEVGGARGDGRRGPSGPGQRPGHGLQGMAERVALHGGTLSAGPRATGGFAVRAVLPLRPARPPEGAPPAWSARPGPPRTGAAR